MASADLPAGLVDLLGPYLSRQRWYAGATAPSAGGLRVVSARELAPTGEGARHLHWAVVEAEGERYQLLVGERLPGDAAEFLNGNERAFIGAVDSAYFYDATLDPELCLKLFGVITAGTQLADRVRPISAEQSNTSLVFDERIIVKVYRRLSAGSNPDVEVTNGLSRVGFAHVAAPYATWREDGVDLAFAQEYLVGGTEGWALAQTSLRDFYNSDGDDPAHAGGDFSGEAQRLGRVTAELHTAMRTVWGAEAHRLAEGDWGRLVGDIEARLRAARGAGSEVDAAPSAPAAGRADDRVDELLRRLRAVDDPGPAQRLHGDYHLGQVMRTDAGWYILDFEGEPARPIEQRLIPASPLKDVAGMLRSLDYAARFAVGERTASTAAVDERAGAWERHNRDAFVAGYLSFADAEELLPAQPDRRLVLAAYELDKALYELAYERGYRPAWMSIPAGAIDRIVSRVT